ncbi:MAG: histone deacetylase [Deltaproteobacteria bacterium]|nr:MAG: histone deacetylase [Deltaproteobacteria bacterium]
MKRLAFAYHPDYLLHTPPFEHPESPERLLAIIERLRTAGLLDRLIPLTPDYAAEEDVLAVHGREYLEKLESACRRGDLTLDAEDTYLNRHSYDVALLSAGGAVAGSKAVAEGAADRAFCAIRPPGHHAGREAGMGFCLMNNVAVAAKYLQARHGVGKVFIVDWDVHHGNGTQSVFLEDPSVFFFSVHEHPTFLYPGTGRRWEIGKGKGEGTTLNAPMAPGAGDDEYRLTFEEMLTPAVERFRPEIILVSAGFDAHRDDPLADIQLSDEGFRFLTRRVAELSDAYCGGRLVAVLEGGYEIGSLTSCIEIHIRELLGE